MRWPILLLVGAAALAVAPVATAQPKKPPGKLDAKTAEAKRLFDQGAAAYAQGSYEDAIKSWQAAYDLSQKPLIFESIANAYERLGDAKQARDYLVRWRDSAPPDEKDLLDARIKNLDARVVREDQAAQAAAAQVQAATAARADADANKTRLWMPGVILGGVGVGAVIAGVVVDILAAKDRPAAGSCKAEGSGPTLCLSSASSVATSNHLALGGDVTWITGAVLAATGATLAIVRRPKSAAAPPASGWVAPMVVGGGTSNLPAGGGIAVGGRF
jgi:tetratricopeptide (TPR) repeat protein